MQKVDSQNTRVCHVPTFSCKKLKEICAVIWTVVKQWFSFSPYEVKELDLSRVSLPLQHQLKNFERAFDYPLGEGKRFRIIHGKGDRDYFGFIKSMGIPKVYVAVNKKERRYFKDQKEVVLKAGEIAGVISGVLKKVGSKKGWYLCDLKVKEEYRGEHIPILLFQRAFWRFFQCPRGYAICMNPNDGTIPKAAQIWDKHGTLGASKLTLNLYNVKPENDQRVRLELEAACGGALFYKSMKGLKDFEIFSETQPQQTTEWNILHIQHGPHGDRTSEAVSREPSRGADHLIAAVQGSQLDRTLIHLGIPQFSSATLIQYGLDPSDFNHTILTNEI